MLPANRNLFFTIYTELDLIISSMMLEIKVLIT